MTYYLLTGAGCALLLIADLTHWCEAKPTLPLIIASAAGLAGALAGGAAIVVLELRQRPNTPAPNPLPLP